MGKPILSVLLALGMFAIPSLLPAQTEDFPTRFTSVDPEEWSLIETDPGAVTVNQGVIRLEGQGGWLQSTQTYGDFTLKTDVRFLTENADSGLFVRVVNDRPFILDWPGNSYQVQVREMSENRSENPIWFGNLYRHRVEEPGETIFLSEEMLRVVRPLGEWQQLEVNLLADSLTVFLNGSTVTRAGNIVNPHGYIGIQVESGVVEYRNMEIRTP